jgi:hypothetical protein
LADADAGHEPDLAERAVLADAAAVIDRLKAINHELREHTHKLIGDPVLASVDALDGDALLLALQHVPPRVRKEVLGRLGLHAGKAPAARAAADLMRQRLRTTDPRLKEWLGLALADPASSRLLVVAGELSGDSLVIDPASLEAALLSIADVSPPLVRLVLATLAQTHDYSAPAALLHLLDDEFILDGWREHRAGLEAAATRAAAEQQQLDLRMRELADSEAEDSGGEDSATVAPVEVVTGNGGEIPSAEPDVAAASDRAHAVTPGGPELGAARDHLKDVRIAQQQAAAASSRIAAAVAEGETPASADLEAQAEFTAAVGDLRARVAAIGASRGVDPGSDAASIAAIEEMLDALERDEAASRQLAAVHRVAELPREHQLFELYRAAQEQAAELCSRAPSTWTDEDRSVCAQLAAIAAAHDHAHADDGTALAVDSTDEAFRGALGLAIGGALPLSAETARGQEPREQEAEEQQVPKRERAKRESLNAATAAMTKAETAPDAAAERSGASDATATEAELEGAANSDAQPNATHSGHLAVADRPAEAAQPSLLPETAERPAPTEVPEPVRASSPAEQLAATAADAASSTTQGRRSTNDPGSKRQISQKQSPTRPMPSSSLPTSAESNSESQVAPARR